MKPITLLQIQTVGPEGEKLAWMFLILFVIVLVAIIFKRKWTMKWPNFSSAISVTIQKNKIYHPTVVSFSITNHEKKAIVIEHPVLRFKRGRRKKAYKIKTVNSKAIYPLYLEPNKTHELPVSLQNFYEFDKKLKRLSRLRIEFTYNKNRFKSSKYVLLKPTLFRKEK